MLSLVMSKQVRFVGERTVRQPRLWLLLLVAAAMLVPAAVLVPSASFAQGSAGSSYDANWAGGNGWCEGAYCFRAWAGAEAVSLRWLVSDSAGADLQVVRLAPGSSDAAVVVAHSEGVGEFSFEDTGVQTGYVYVYQLVQAPDQSLGQPLEAGLAAQAMDPGPDVPKHKVYLPLLALR
jgi:hypothetical protein